MKSFIISTAAALFLTLTYAAPTPQGPVQFLAQITFEGATPEAYFTQSVPTDGSVFYISKSYIHLLHYCSCLNFSALFSTIQAFCHLSTLRSCPLPRVEMFDLEN
jgi:hypothetical protein